MAAAGPLRLTWRHFPGVVDAGRRARQDGVALAECPYDLGTPRQLAWDRGWIAEEMEQRHQA